MPFSSFSFPSFWSLPDSLFPAFVNQLNSLFKHPSNYSSALCKRQGCLLALSSPPSLPQLPPSMAGVNLCQPLTPLKCESACAPLEGFATFFLALLMTLVAFFSSFFYLPVWLNMVQDCDFSPVCQRWDAWTSAFCSSREPARLFLLDSSKHFSYLPPIISQHILFFPAHNNLPPPTLPLSSLPTNLPRISLF